MVIVAGHLMVAPEQRDEYVTACITVEQARRADGCLDFALTADSVDPGRVNVFERWVSQAAVGGFRGSGPEDGSTPPVLASSVSECDVAAVRHL